MLRAWCDTGDEFCDSGDDTRIHGTYFSNYTNAASQFVVDLFNHSKASSTGTATGSSTPSATGGSKSGAASIQPMLSRAEVYGVLVGLIFMMLI